MDASDITPTRLTRARHKVLDIVTRRREGYTALIVYAGEPFVVTPLTEDTATIAALVPSLSTDLMPVQGSRPDLALHEAATLIAQAGIARGHVLLLTDGVADSRVHDAAVHLRDQGHRLSVLAVGTEDGAPIVLPDGRLLQDSQGSIVVPKMDAIRLRTLVQAGGGRYSRFRLDDSDVDHLIAGVPVNRMDRQMEDTGLHTALWREEGPWLLLVVLPIAAIAFRRGCLMTLVVVWLVVPVRAYPFDWNALWSNSNQRASQALEQGEAEHAAELFSNPQWKAVAQYRAEQFDHAVTSLEGIDTPDALYNKGNAFARLGRFPEALDAYDAALGLDNTHEDARYNRDLIQEFLDQQQRQQDGRGGESNDQHASGGESSEEQQSLQKPLNGREGESDDQHISGGEGSGEQQSLQKHLRPLDHQLHDASSADAMADEHWNQRVNQQEPGTANQHGVHEGIQEDQGEAQRIQSMPPHDAADSRDQRFADVSETLESRQAYEQWLRRIPDDPGGLLRRKFLYQYQQRSNRTTESIQW